MNGSLARRIGRNIAALRVARDWSQEALAARVKVSRSRLSKLLPGGRAIDRVRDLGTREIAADYAAWVVRSAARLGRCVGVRLTGGRYLSITLEGPAGAC